MVSFKIVPIHKDVADSPFTAPRPYRNVGPIFIHANACKPYAHESVVPLQLRLRLLSLRSYDGAEQMVAADVVEGRDIEEVGVGNENRRIRSE